MLDMKTLGDAVIVAVKGHVGKAVAALSERLDDFDRRLKALQAPVKGDPGEDADPAVILAMVKEAVAGIPKPVDGKAYDPEVLLAAVEASVAEQVKKLPPATPGRDADPAVLAKMVDDAVKALPFAQKGEDGKSVDLVEFSAQIIAAAAKAVEALPKPANGKDYDPEVLKAAVVDAVKALPPAQPGKDADPELMRAEVERVVAEQVKLLPPAQPGKDADLATVSKMVADAVALLPKPEKGEDGKSVDLVWLAGQIVAAAGEAIKSMPPPADGKDFDPDLLEAAVKRAVDQIPRPEPGTPGKSVTLEDVVPLVAAEVAKVAEAFKPQKGEPGSDADPLLMAVEVETQVAKALRTLPPPAPGKDADPEVLRAAVESAVADQIKKLPPAPPGKGADPELIAREVATQVNAAVKALPPPAAGKDADSEAIGAAVLEKVLKVLDEIPPPEPGKDADPVLVESTVRAEVERLWEAMPKPQDGKSVDMVQLAGEIAAAAAKAVAAIEKPADGKDYDPEVLKTEVKLAAAASQTALAESVLSMTTAAIKSLPIPDKAAERTVIAEVVREELDKAERPSDGKDADPEKTAAVVAEQLAAALKTMPPPAPGKDADPAVVAELVAKAVSQIPVPDYAAMVREAIDGPLQDAVAQAVKALPPAESIRGDPGKDLDPATVAELLVKAIRELPKPDVTALVRIEVAEALKAIMTQPKPTPKVDMNFSERVSKALGKPVEILAEEIPNG